MMLKANSQPGRYLRAEVPGRASVKRFTIGRFVHDGERCTGCPHPPHLGPCTARNGQTALPCPCTKDRDFS